MGPTYRSDMWAALEINPDLTPAELARQTYGSFPTAVIALDWEWTELAELIRNQCREIAATVPIGL